MLRTEISEGANEVKQGKGRKPLYTTSPMSKWKKELLLVDDTVTSPLGSAMTGTEEKPTHSSDRSK